MVLAHLEEMLPQRNVADAGKNLANAVDCNLSLRSRSHYEPAQFIIPCPFCDRPPYLGGDVAHSVRSGSFLVPEWRRVIAPLQLLPQQIHVELDSLLFDQEPHVKDIPRLPPLKQRAHLLSNDFVDAQS